MLISENFFQSNQLDQKKLSTFMKSVVDIELMGVPSNILRSSQFKSLYLDYYRELFQNALNVTNLKLVCMIFSEYIYIYINNMINVYFFIYRVKIIKYLVVVVIIIIIL